MQFLALSNSGSGEGGQWQQVCGVLHMVKAHVDDQSSVVLRFLNPSTSVVDIVGQVAVVVDDCLRQLSQVEDPKPCPGSCSLAAVHLRGLLVPCRKSSQMGSIGIWGCS